MNYTTLFIEIELIDLLVNPLDEYDITGVHHQGLSPLHTSEVIGARIVE